MDIVGLKASKCRERSANFTPNEIQRLTMLVDSHKDIILNPKTDGNSWSMKEQAWAAIEKEFNQDRFRTAQIGYRTARQLKIKFDNLKKSWRKSNDNNSAPDLSQTGDRVSLSEDETSNQSLDDILAGAQSSYEDPTMQNQAKPDNKTDDRDGQLQRLRLSHEAELHKQQLRHKEEEHARKMAAIEAKSLRDEQEHLLRMEEFRLKIKVLKRECGEDTG